MGISASRAPLASSGTFGAVSSTSPMKVERSSQDETAAVRSSTTARLEEKSTPVRFEESAWSIPLVLGLADVGWFDATSAMLLVLLNFGMQVAFSGVLLSDSFMGDAFETKVTSAKTWRTRAAHDYAYLDLG
ncbi:unnamed protein product, partial [Symbiodinium pilosum]